MPATVTIRTNTGLTPTELEELLKRERAKGNPLALFAGSCVDPDDPDDEAFREAVRKHRNEQELQLQEIESLENAENRSQV